MARIPAPTNVRAALERRIVPLTGDGADHDDLLDLVGDARVVMLGEASHGTHEFYAVRAAITERLIARGGFRFVAIEGDWPDAYQVDRWVRGGPGTVRDALAGFKRFPTWMWRNVPVEAFLNRLRAHNDAAAMAGWPQVGFYGLDVYGLHAAMAHVLAYLRKADPVAAEAVAAHYACLRPFEADTQAYAAQVHYHDASCEDEVIAALMEVWSRRERYAALDAEAHFAAELDALTATNAERYYRHMVRGGATTWNLRDRHMAAVLERLLDHHGPGARAIVWAHNSHVGDFRATYDGRGGHLNVGQLVRERHGAAAVAVGFGTHRGTVTAARAWDGPAEFMPVPPAREGSYEDAFEQLGPSSFYLPLAVLAPADPAGAWLRETRGERAIGVVYDPRHERAGNYVPSRLARRYDAYYFFAESLAVEPLDEGPQAPGLEAFPSGL